VLDADFDAVHMVAGEMRFARTRPFYDMPESKQKGTGGLLSVTINPETCKGCNLCVAVCPDQALVTVKQDDANLGRLRRNWDFWQRLPDTADRYVNVSNLDEGIGVLPSLLLKKATYRSMVGGDGACMGCGEKTAVHLILSAVHALMGPRVEKYVTRLDTLIAALDEKARKLLAADAKLEAATLAAETFTLPLDDAKRETIAALTRSIEALRDLRWRYVEGPSGKGRARLGMANSTGCSSVWASTYPYNPYPFPWVNHLFQDAPSIAIGVFEAHMRKMADGFIGVRRAELLLADRYERATHEPEFAAFDWSKFDDDEFDMCPPIFAMGGDGAMLDIGFQNLSRLLASGKPVRVVVLDTQVYSNTGGQACTSGFTGQVADMSAWGARYHGKTEARKELALIAIAHRGAFVHQSSQASPSHLMAGVLRGLHKRRPVVFNVYTPCPVEHGLADNSAQRAARLALESRAFPFLTYDPDGGTTLADCLTLDGNPAKDDAWPTYALAYTDDDGAERTMDVPMTIADWAATEGRFRKHFKEVPRDKWSDEMVQFHEYIRLSPDERTDRMAFIWTVDRDRHLRRLRVSPEIVALAEERLGFWSELRQMAGDEVAPVVRDRLLSELELEYEGKAAALRAEYDARLNEMKQTYPALLARRLAEGLLRSAGGHHTVSEFLAVAERASVPASPVTQTPVAVASVSSVSASNGTLASGAAQTVNGTGVAVQGANGEPKVATVPQVVAAGTPVAATTTAPAAAVAVADDDMAIEPSIDSARCTTCNECTNLNNRLFAYNAEKQAYIKDPKAGTFAQLVQAAEKCPVSVIHPGTPLNPKERDLAKWIERAKPFN
jgi:pyruvate-ferredoxin/flavodoxin oxidoreductase